MASKREDLIRLLEAELDFVEGGGYGAPAGQPNKEQPLFFHSPACINHWHVPGHRPDCHDDCILMDAVPGDHKKEALPCHHIPLNQAGETVKSLEDRGDRERAEEEVKAWLRLTIERLKAGDIAPGLPDDIKY